MSKGYFIVGTNTDIGKTYVTKLMIKELVSSYFHVSYYKAALSGVDDNTLSDEQIMKTITPHTKVSYTMKPALSPHLAARLENVKIDFELIKQDIDTVKKMSDYVIMEGSGGIICPLYQGESMLMLEDVIQYSQYPIILITHSELGCINHTVLTLHYAKQKNIPIAGIIMNDYDANNSMHQDNKDMIEMLSRIPVIGLVKKDGKCIDWLNNFLL